MTWLVDNAPGLGVVLASFALIIVVHEFGHFTMARLAGIGVHEFALGLGPRLLSRRHGETEYSLRALPLGGFVRLKGLEDPDAAADDPRSFENKGMWRQVAVLSGGCIMNYVSSFLVLLVVAFCHGAPGFTPLATTEVARVAPDGPAATAGILPGDRVVAIDGQRIETRDDIVKRIQPGRAMEITVRRGRAESTFSVVPAEKIDARTGQRVPHIGVIAGIVMVPTFEPAGPLEGVARCMRWFVRTAALPVTFAYNLAARRVPARAAIEDSGGPLLVGRMLFEIYERGIWALLFLWALMSASVGTFNLLPLPALDGARVLFRVIGAVRGTPVDPRQEGLVHLFGLAFLMMILVLVSIRDVSRILNGMRFFS